jgi:very-short-patch-repair endonuclease
VHGHAQILERRLAGYEPGESDPEKRIAELLERSGLPRPTRQHRVQITSRTARVDLCYPEQRVAIEYDSWKYHSGRRAFDEDGARSNELVVLGFAVLHFTSKSTNDQIVDTVRAALTRASDG